MQTHTAREVLLDDPDEAREEALCHVDRGYVGAREPAARRVTSYTGRGAPHVGRARPRRPTNIQLVRCTQRAEAGGVYVVMKWAGIRRAWPAASIKQPARGLNGCRQMQQVQ